MYVYFFLTNCIPINQPQNQDSPPRLQETMETLHMQEKQRKEQTQIQPHFAVPIYLRRGQIYFYTFNYWVDLDSFLIYEMSNIPTDVLKIYK